MPRCTPTGWELKCHRLNDQRPDAEVSEDQAISPTNMEITSINPHLCLALSIRQSATRITISGLSLRSSPPSAQPPSSRTPRLKLAALLRCIQQGDQAPSFLIPCVPSRPVFSHPISRRYVVVPHSKKRRHTLNQPVGRSIPAPCPRD